MRRAVDKHGIVMTRHPDGADGSPGASFAMLIEGVTVKSTLPGGRTLVCAPPLTSSAVSVLSRPYRQSVLALNAYTSIVGVVTTICGSFQLTADFASVVAHDNRTQSSDSSICCISAAACQSPAAFAFAMPVCSMAAASCVAPSSTYDWPSC